jgi:tRNA(Ile)-lysidine synthase
LKLPAKLSEILRSPPLLLPTTAKILIAVSGGQDSFCLAKLLLMLQPRWHWQLAIAHCDHRWREDSAANAEHVANLAKKLGFTVLVAHRHQLLLSMKQQQGNGAMGN